MNLYITATGRYAGTQAEAKADGKGWTPEVVPTDKPGLIAYLNALSLKEKMLQATADIISRDDLLLEGDPNHEPSQFEGLEPRPSYTHQSVELDEQWDKLPLARKLHFAALAMEEARAKL